MSSGYTANVIFKNPAFWLLTDLWFLISVMDFQGKSAYVRQNFSNSGVLPVFRGGWVTSAGRWRILPCTLGGGEGVRRRCDEPDIGERHVPQLLAMGTLGLAPVADFHLPGELGA